MKAEYRFRVKSISHIEQTRKSLDTLLIRKPRIITFLLKVVTKKKIRERTVDYINYR